MHRGHCRQGVHLSLGLHGERLSSRTKLITADTTPSWDVPGWKGWGKPQNFHWGLSRSQFSPFPNKVTGQASSMCPGRSESQSTLCTGQFLGRTLRLAPNHLPAFPPLLLSPSWDISSASTLTLNYQPKGTLCTGETVLWCWEAEAGFHTQIPACERDTSQPTGCLPKVPPLYSPMIHSEHFLMTSFLVTNSFSSHILNCC